MVKTAGRKGMTASAYKSAGTTRDGVRVVAPKTKPKNFTASEIQRAVKIALKELQKPNAKPKIVKEKVPRVEQRPDGTFALTRPGRTKATAKKATQKEALDLARELEPGIGPIAKRTRTSKSGRKGTWRKA